MSVKPRTNLLLDIAIFIIFTLVITSGLLSHTLVGHDGLWQRLRLLGLDRHFLNDFHMVMALVMLGMVAVHLIIHWKWITSQLEKLRQH